MSKKTKEEKRAKKDSNENVMEVLNSNLEDSKVEILPDVIATIVNVEVEKNLDVRKSTNWTDAFGSKNSKGMRIDITGNTVKVDLSILTKYGQRIPDIAYSLQSAIKREVENMTGLRVLEVNINVQGIFQEGIEEEIESDYEEEEVND